MAGYDGIQTLHQCAQLSKEGKLAQYKQGLLEALSGMKAVMPDLEDPEQRLLHSLVMDRLVTGARSGLANAVVCNQPRRQFEPFRR